MKYFKETFCLFKQPGFLIFLNKVPFPWIYVDITYNISLIFSYLQQFSSSYDE